jgi:hypothetical protein
VRTGNQKLCASVASAARSPEQGFQSAIAPSEVGAQIAVAMGPSRARHSNHFGQVRPAAVPIEHALSSSTE